jgi:hypothetical protein
MIVLTVATHTDGYLPALQKSCELSKLNLIVLGYGEQWGGLSWKLKKASQYLQSFENKDDVCIFVDAFDVVLTRMSDNAEFEIVDEFKKFKKPILVGLDGEPESLLGKYALDRVFGICRGYHLNSGLYMGRVHDLERFLSLLLKKSSGKFEENDQSLLMSACKYNENWFDENVAFDVQQKIFHTSTCAVSFSMSTTFDKSNLLYSPTLSRPFFIHGAGNCDMDEIVSKLRLPHGKRRTHYEYASKALQQYLPHFIPELSIIALLIVYSIYYFMFSSSSTSKSTVTSTSTLTKLLHK